MLLVAKFNQRYHHSGGALLAALTALGCEAAACDERTRGLDALLRRSLEHRLAAALRRHRPDLVLVFKGARLDAGLVARLRAQTAARWANWFPDDPHLLDLSVTLSPLYDPANVSTIVRTSSSGSILGLSVSARRSASYGHPRAAGRRCCDATMNCALSRSWKATSIIDMRQESKATMAMSRFSSRTARRSFTNSDVAGAGSSGTS